ncbi:DUF2059 domain-containing protein [Massilia aurea]|uniref:DUF2059 domain-containing protein n=1 Tax=Massilia aurea TaxID=373040 RepID=UPI0034635715
MKHILFAVIVACSALPARAQAPLPVTAISPQADAAVKELLDAMDVRTMMTASFAEMEKTMPAVMRAQALAEVNADPGASEESRADALARIDRFVPHAAEAVSRLMRDPALIDQMVAEIGPLYARHYTVAELQQLTAFYRTPLGRKMLALSPRLGAESMAIGQRVVAPRLSALLTEVMQSAQVK